MVQLAINIGMRWLPLRPDRLYVAQRERLAQNICFNWSRILKVARTAECNAQDEMARSNEVFGCSCSKKESGLSPRRHFAFQYVE
ncbi:unnamed protein product [Paramecium sonneborni]|uniref:Uncharacterized protein n=1 Tax=Paramecium sonneborni TaxID=65129 RepID=A0A8S1R1V9_9CILI|nr:unnamed protein product [Paramecium sonneborni]